MINQPPVLKSIFCLSNSFKWFPYGFLMLYLSWNHMNTRTHHCWSLKIWKNYYSPNDRFLIKFFIKIISLDSSQRVPPMSPCPPLIIIRVCPLLINPHVRGRLFREDWGKTLQGIPWPIIGGRGGWLIWCWHYSSNHFIYIYIYIYSSI